MRNGLLYGHHMVSGQMFGDLEKYQDAAFLETHTGGTLLLPDRTCRLEVLGWSAISASEERIFEPETQDIAALLDWAQDTALCWRADAPVPERVLACRPARRCTRMPARWCWRLYGRRDEAAAPSLVIDGISC